jgi:uncharacterized membrane protein
MNEESNFVTSLIFLMISVALLLFPPDKKNGYYGYRTQRSFKSPENWKMAQRISSVVMITCAVITFSVSVYAHNSKFYFHAAFHGLFPGLILTVLFTELWLWKKGTK